MDSRNIAVDFLNLVVTGKIDEAYDKYIAEDFIHHNPYFPAGAEALKKAMKDDAKENPPKHLEIKQTTCDGDLVMVHSQIILNDKDQSMVTVHIFKLNKSQIIELWDIVQQIPDDSPNQDGMF